MNAIEIRNLTVAYGENIALENLNLDVEAGSLMALVRLLYFYDLQKIQQK